MRRMIVFALGFAAAVLMPAAAAAHCDGLDGPVVTAARKALETGNLRLALVWVRERDEPEITAAFEKTMKVRGLGGDARSLADTYFFETLVRVHRAGEGAAYVPFIHYVERLYEAAVTTAHGHASDPHDR